MPSEMLARCGEGVFDPAVIGCEGSEGLAAGLLATLELFDPVVQAELIANIVKPLPTPSPPTRKRSACSSFLNERDKF